MTAGVITLNMIGVRTMSPEERLVLVDIPGIGIVYNELPKIAEELGLSVSDISRISQLSFPTVKRIWENDGTQGVTFETLVKLVVALNRSITEVFPIEVHPRYFNPYTYKENGDS